MAKVGEGDSRWIVEHRADGTNVNNWHWSEKDISTWAKRRVKELLKEVEVKGAAGSAKVMTISKCEGDATLYNRKGVLKTVYDLTVHAKWEGTESGSEEVSKGDIKFEVFDDDPEISIGLESSSGRSLKKLLDTEGKELIRQKMLIFSKEVRDGGDADLGDDIVKAGASKVTTSKNMTNQNAPVKTVKPQTTPTISSSAESLKIEEFFRASPRDMFLALTDSSRVTGYTGQQAKIVCRPKGDFSLCNGAVTGIHLELSEGRRVLQQWRMSKWPPGKMSEVEIILENDEGHTKLTLVQNGIPKEHRYDTEEFWRRTIFERMKVVLGYGTSRYF